MTNLQSIIEKFLTNDEKEMVAVVENIVSKINNLSSGRETTIAELIDYNPKVTFVEPLTQGKVYRCVKAVCKELNIKLEESDRSFGGLAYNFKFTKC